MRINHHIMELNLYWKTYVYKFSYIVIFYFVNISVYYAASILHTKWCTPPTCIGFLFSPFMVTTPHCVSFQWIIYFGGNYLRNTWIMIGTYMIHLYLSWSGTQHRP